MMRKLTVLLFVVAVFPAVAESILSVPNLEVNGTESGNFLMGQNWTVTLSGGPSGEEFEMCYLNSFGSSWCIPAFGTTDANGSWISHGTFDFNDMGGWVQWIKFPNHKVSNRIFRFVEDKTANQLTINDKRGGTFAPGQDWTLTLASNHRNSAFSICGIIDGGPAGCTGFNFGKTDANGQYTLSGTFENSQIGHWIEWIRFPDGKVSNTITFKIDANVPPQLRVNGDYVGNFIIGEQWTLDMSGAPLNTDFDLCVMDVRGRALSCSNDFGTTDSDGNWRFSGSFSLSSLGNWMLAARFPSGRMSDWVDFTVSFPHYHLFAMDFGPYIGGQSPNAGSVISDDQIRRMLSAITPFTNGIRTYSITGLENVVKIARDEFGLQTYVGAWLDSNIQTNSTELSNLISLMNEGYASVGIVGSEVLSRHNLSETTLISYVDHIRSQAPNTPIATADIANVLAEHSKLVDLGDVIFANIYPFWEGQNVEAAVSLLHSTYTKLQDQYPDKEIIVSETGWPSEGQTIGDAIPSPQNAADYLLNVVSWSQSLGVKIMYFEAFDEQWKTAYEGQVGGHWGILDQDGNLKPGMIDVFLGKTVTDNWSQDTSPPSIPQNLRVYGISYYGLTVAWDPSSDNVGVFAYILYRDGQGIVTLGKTRTSYYDSGLSPSTKYSYQVAARDEAGNISPKSESVIATTAPPPPDTFAPKPPTSVTSSINVLGHVELSWVAAIDTGASTSGIASYEIYRRLPGGNFTIIGIVEGDSTRYTDDGVYPSMTYEYALKSVDGAGNKSYYSEIVRVPVPCSAGPINGPGSPSIAFISVPALGSNGSVQGRVSHVNPTESYVAVFIYVPGYGWVTKPYWSSPKTPINCDGSWSAAITTGGHDQDATEIVAYLFPSSYDVPLATGNSSLPPGLDAHALASVSVSR